MSKVLVTESYLSATGSAIREKAGTQTTYKPSQFASAILSLSTVADLSVGSKTISANGSYTPSGDNLDFYSQVTVNVEANLGSLSVSENGTYSASLASLDGYSEVVVDVPQPSGAINISENGSYNVGAYSEAVVSVSGMVPTGSINISENGIYDVGAYSQAVVSVETAGNLGTLEVSSNGTYSASVAGYDGYSEVIVSVDASTNPVLQPVSDGVLASASLFNLFSIKRFYAENITSIGDMIGAQVEEIEVPNCTAIAVSAFRGNKIIKKVIAPNAILYMLNNNNSGINFSAASALEAVSLDVAHTLPGYAFYGCNNLKSLYAPNVARIYSRALGYCSMLTVLSFPKLSLISASAFEHCNNLQSLYLLSTAMVQGSTSMFAYTPMVLSSYLGHFGSIYVPSILYNDYITNSIWSSVSARIVGYTQTPVLSDINVETLPTKSSYIQGETLSLTGVNISATYTDSSVVDVTSLCTFNPSAGDTLSVLGSQVVTVAYTESDVTKTTSFDVTVEQTSEKTLLSIGITSLPTTLSYDVWGQLDLSGISVRAYYNDNTYVVVTDVCSYNPSSGTDLSVAGSQTVNVSYWQSGVTKTSSFDIMVEAVPVGSVSSMEIKRLPDKSIYMEDEALDLYGVAVKAIYDNNHTGDITSLCSFDPISGTVFSSRGWNTLTASYTSDGVTKSSTVSIPVTYSYSDNTTTFLASDNTLFSDGFVGHISMPALVSAESSAFKGLSFLSGVWINAIQGIEYCAFADCSRLGYVYAGSCSFIGQWAFKNCDDLRVVYASSLEYIGYEAFGRCRSLSEASHPECLTIGSYAFTDCYKLSNISFPKCSQIGEQAFYYAGIENLDLPSVTKIASSTFFGCGSLSRISLYDCSQIMGNAFAYCTSIRGLYMRGSSVCQLWNADVFYNTTFTESYYLSQYGSIYVPSSMYQDYIQANGWSVYEDRFASFSPSIEGAFRSDSTVTSLSDASATVIGVSTYGNCINLSAVSLPEVTQIGLSAFYEDKNLTDVYLPKVETVGSYAFAWCSGLTSISLPECKVLEHGAFHLCDLESISLPKCERVGQMALDGTIGASNLKTISLPVCSYIGYYALRYNTSLMSVYLMSTSVVELENAASQTFRFTPIMDNGYTGSYGSIFVPTSLRTQYINDSKWFMIEDRIVGI